MLIAMLVLMVGGGEESGSVQAIWSISTLFEAFARTTFVLVFASNLYLHAGGVLMF